MTDKPTNVLEAMLNTLDQAENAASEQLEEMKKAEKEMLDATLEDVGKLSGQAGAHCADLLEQTLLGIGREVLAHGALLSCSCLERQFILLDFVVKVVAAPLLRAYEQDGYVDCEQLAKIISEASSDRVERMSKIESSSHSAANKLRTFLSAIQAQGAEKH